MDLLLFGVGIFLALILIFVASPAFAKMQRERRESGVSALNEKLRDTKAQLEESQVEAQAANDEVEKLQRLLGHVGERIDLVIDQPHSVDARIVLADLSDKVKDALGQDVDLHPQSKPYTRTEPHEGEVRPQGG